MEAQSHGGGNDRGISGRCEGGDRARIQAEPSKLESTLFKLVKTTSLLGSSC
jgi:hypothetical protein